MDVKGEKTLVLSRINQSNTKKEARKSFLIYEWLYSCHWQYRIQTLKSYSGNFDVAKDVFATPRNARNVLQICTQSSS